MGPVAYAMLRKLTEASTGEAGFRPSECSRSAINNGWVHYVWNSGRVTFYAITKAGHEAYIEACRRRS